MKFLKNLIVLINVGKDIWEHHPSHLFWIIIRSPTITFIWRTTLSKRMGRTTVVSRMGTNYLSTPLRYILLFTFEFFVIKKFKKYLNDNKINLDVRNTVIPKIKENILLSMNSVFFDFIWRGTVFEFYNIGETKIQPRWSEILLRNLRLWFHHRWGFPCLVNRSEHQSLYWGIQSSSAYVDPKNA